MATKGQVKTWVGRLRGVPPTTLEPVERTETVH